MSVSNVAVIKPPTTTVASGRCTSAPAEVKSLWAKNQVLQPKLLTTQAASVRRCL